MTAAEIAHEMRAMADRLLAIADTLDPGVTLPQMEREADGFHAPYGYTKDGTPRQRPGRRKKQEPAG